MEPNGNIFWTDDLGNAVQKGIVDDKIIITTQGSATKSFPYDYVNIKLTFNGEKENEDSSSALASVTNAMSQFDKLVWAKINKPIKKKFRPNLNSTDNISRSFTMSFDYSKDTLIKFIDLTENSLKQKPFYEITFSFKDPEKNYNQVLEIAAKNAKQRAITIANGIGAKIKICQKVEFNDAIILDAKEGRLASNPLLADNYEIPLSQIDKNIINDDKTEIKKNNSLTKAIISHIKDTFVMEEVEINAVIKCVWLAQ
ncbi:MAG: SIMPL domain-containing protein [Christensenellaceae bacterium]|jgi:hypothetical protein|nr:SIMPL domain-containing protein [Christensenellaceae bacterium]